jgi:hypothetical protein
MLMRSTGLGKTELTGKIDQVQRQGDYLILYVDVIDPVKWRLRVGLNFRDLAKVVACMAKSAVLTFLFSPKQWSKKEPGHPGDF